MVDHGDVAPRRGDEIQCPWSSTVLLLDVLYTFRASVGVFYGVLAESQDKYGWPLGLVGPLWVLSHRSKLRVWHDIQQWPQSTEQFESDIERVIGHYEAENGDVYYAIQWKGYICPTWELEEKLADKTRITSYCLALSESE
ncbi:hypothetical protein VFPPC_17463 [Pochonia chlamydosporia 170]|uniref:Chromo domain-containing protein n=1 Tax=Pochonia chlamydosporia 170 TaxID=1380566 RepID=A0A219ASU2_METCM|nr:hypothetical protein VFPPC_17463 [Pochonia chlamydosporia 170]OWT43374.1 hypothetical protein VFPPC_17463 [Pochonia chlamydosporia 170]